MNVVWTGSKSSHEIKMQEFFKFLETRYYFSTKIANNEQNGNLKLLEIDNSKSLPKKKRNVKKNRSKCHKNYVKLGDKAEN